MKVVNYSETVDKVMEFWKNGAQEPLDLSMGKFSDFYGVRLGSCTDITGYPYSGKSLLLKEIITNLNVKHNIKQMLFLPDDGTNIEVITSIIHKLTGKSFDKRYNNYIGENEVYKNLTMLMQEFVFIESEQRLTPIEIWKKSIEMNCVTCSVDSWNYLKHDEGTKYLANTLSERNMIAERNNAHFFTIIHPRNPNSNDYNTEGKLKPPNQFNLMGGSEWNNNGKSIISVHKEGKESKNYDIYINKIKPKNVGRTGMCTIQFDIPSQRFYHEDLTGLQKKFFYDNGSVEQKPLDLSKIDNGFDTVIDNEMPF